MSARTQSTSEHIQCFHCGEDCTDEVIAHDDKQFCCDGCKLVYELLQENDLCTYYNFNEQPGISLKKGKRFTKFDFLEEDKVKQKLIHFTDGKQTSVTFYIPQIHCSSCIWLLENLYRLKPGIIRSQVNFLKKEAHITFSEDDLSLREVAELLSSIGYEPLISLNDIEKKEAKQKNTKSFYYKLGIAGFAFGNIMLLSFPEYFTLGETLDTDFRQAFGYLNLALSLPVLLYSSSDFFKSAFSSIQQKFINIDVPIALGISVMFLRSSYEIISGGGGGYMDSLTGLVFFMLIGRYFQNKTYDTLSFERDYKSYFPVAVTVIKDGIEKSVSLSDLKPGNRILIRNNELIPADSILMKGDALIDYSFVTGEAKPEEIDRGKTVYAGGKQTGSAIELEVTKEVSQSYLTRLWNNDAFQEKAERKLNTLINRVSKHFTITVILIAAGSALFWMPNDISRSLNAFTAVLIIACPCALALASPFTLGNIMRLFGKQHFYVKNSEVIESLSQVDVIVFDKTGTITQAGIAAVEYEGEELNDSEKALLKSLVRHSSHPLSKSIYDHLDNDARLEVKHYQELPGKGITGWVNGIEVKLGSPKFVLPEGNITGKAPETGRLRHSKAHGMEAAEARKTQASKVVVEINGKHKGQFLFRNKYRENFEELINELSAHHELALLSGDNDSERAYLAHIFPAGSILRFNQAPQDKLEFIRSLQSQNKKVLMIGDGLNDAGALKQSDIGISVSDDVNNFSPACDAILSGNRFSNISKYFRFSKAGKKVIIAAFIISFLYNFAGLSFAVQGILSPVVAAILMPLSSITIVGFTTLSTSLVGRWLKV